MPALRKALVELAATDFQGLIDGEWIEDETLEFKRTLSQSSSGNADKWLSDQSEIGNAAKRDLLAEVVAMANSYGGDVILGIIEADEKPPRAAGINPLPKCVELASRLEHAARDLIKPQIPMLGVRGVPIDGESGVVIFRIPRSRAAPHRLEMKGIEKECYRRVSDRSEPMTMREIQDLTFTVSRGLKQTEQRLSDVRAEFSSWLGESSPNASRCGFAVSGVPLSSDLYIAKVHSNPLVTPEPKSFNVWLGEQPQPIRFECPNSPYQWRPILRGTETVAHADTPYAVLRRLNCDGTLVEFDGLHVSIEDSAKRTSLYLYPNWVFASVLNLFEGIDKYRTAAGAHSIDYAVELTLVGDAPFVVRRMGEGGIGGFMSELGNFPKGVTRLPIYHLGERDSWHDTLNLMWCDFFNAIGRDFGQETLRVEGW